MKDEPYALGRTPFMDLLFEGIENEPSMRGCADVPANDLAGIGVDDKGDIDEPLPCGNTGEIRQPKYVGRRHAELAGHLVQRAGPLLVGNRRLVRLSSNNPLNIHVLHQSRDRAASNIELLTAHLAPDVAHAVDLVVLLPDTFDLGPQSFVPLGEIRQ